MELKDVLEQVEQQAEQLLFQIEDLEEDLQRERFRFDDPRIQQATKIESGLVALGSFVYKQYETVRDKFPDQTTLLAKIEEMDHLIGVAYEFIKDVIIDLEVLSEYAAEQLEVRVFPDDETFDKINKVEKNMYRVLSLLDEAKEAVEVG